MRTRLAIVALAATFSIVASLGFSQTQPPPPQTNEPALSDEKAKSQQNSADESAPRAPSDRRCQ